jgi:pyruvate-ferredoxin/flavodoxin oxidoreductase
MSTPRTITCDGNEAAASVAHRVNDVIAIYPITPSSNMGEACDTWSAQGRRNIWGTVPLVAEMQSEGGASGAVHGALQGGALATTFTSSQGLLLMIPNMGKIAGDLTPFTMHVAARAVGHNGISIFGDHSDVMACRSTGFAMLASASVQQAHDFALVAQAASLRSRVPFLHFFDGFRTSHEVAKIAYLEDDDLRTLIDDGLVAEHRARALSPDHPVLRGTTQNADTFFQTREACTPFLLACPGIVQKTMDQFAARTGRSYHLFDYVGAADAERIVVVMGSAAETVEEYVTWASSRGEKIGAVIVRLFRPFSPRHLLEALPSTAKRIAVLDRYKEPGAVGDPLYLETIAALAERGQAQPMPLVIAGRYGLGGKEFTPASVRAVFAELHREQPKQHFTVGITDDVTGSSIAVHPSFDIEPDDVTRAVFYGIGSDGTVGANKNSIGIINEGTPNHGQGYFVYDSKKAGTVTISHLRFGPRPIHSTYLVRKASFVACHQTSLVERHDMLRVAAPGATFLLNTPAPKDEVWASLPREYQTHLVRKKMRLFAIDAYAVAHELGLGARINTIMQACFFAIAGVMPYDEAVLAMKKSVEKTYGAKGKDVVRQNFAAIDAAWNRLHEIPIGREESTTLIAPPVPEGAPQFVQRVTGPLMAGKGDALPVSAFPADGTWPTGTSKWEKRNIALEIPAWDADLCAQCNKCAMLCPHAAIRPNVYPPTLLRNAPATFQHANAVGKDYHGMKYTLQVAPEDCTGCGVCVAVCPVESKKGDGRKAIHMVAQAPRRESEAANFTFFRTLPPPGRTTVRRDVKGSQLLEPLFEYAGACAGCGQTPYIKLLTQLFGDRAIIANATGCSSVYGGNLPTTPYTTNAEGRGPAWCNSLFEDNAEFGYGLRLAVDKHREQAWELVEKLMGSFDPAMVETMRSADQTTEAGIVAQRERVDTLRRVLSAIDSPEASRLRALSEYLVHKSIWLVGGDGWAYDIGYGGLDHVLAQGRNVNVLVLDTEVYSNTGGQASKATPLGAAARFAMGGKSQPKKDLGMMAMAYGNVYVARVAMGAKDTQTVKAFLEAESYDGPSLILAYCPCIAHGIDMTKGCDQQKLAVKTGHWPLYRYDPRRIEGGDPPLQLDSAAPTADLETYVGNETRYTMVRRADGERFATLMETARHEVAKRWALHESLSTLRFPAKRPG